MIMDKAMSCVNSQCPDNRSPFLKKSSFGLSARKDDDLRLSNHKGQYHEVASINLTTLFLFVVDDQIDSYLKLPRKNLKM